MEKIIEITNLKKQFKQGNKTINAVDDTTLSVKEGEFFVIIGPSGSGKSTLLQLLGGLDRPTSGEIVIDGQNLTKSTESKMTKIRRQKIGFIFQNFNLISTLTAAQNIEAAIASRGSDDQQKVLEVLKKVGLEDRANHLPALLSGGEQQRVAIARALINDPKIILADEPTGNLDSKTGEEIMNILLDLNKNNHQTVILITHSDYVKKYATHIVEIKDGKLSRI